MLLMMIKLRGGSNGRGGMLWKGGVPYIHGCCGGVVFPTSIIIYITIIIIITSVSKREGRRRERVQSSFRANR